MEISSLFYRNTLAMNQEESSSVPIIHRPGEQKRRIRAFRVDFDLKIGQKITLTLGEQPDDLLSHSISFNSMPDLLSHKISRDAFVFSKRVEGHLHYFYSLFLQEKDPGADRGYLQSSVVIETNYLSIGLLEALDKQPITIKDITVDKLNVLLNMEEMEAEDRGVECLAGQIYRDLVEEIFRCRSILVICPLPSLCSRFVERITRILNFRYGGEIHPYVSMGNVKEVESRGVVGVTSEHIIDCSRFDNVIRISDNDITIKRKEKRMIRDKSINVMEPLEEQLRIEAGRNSPVFNVIELCKRVDRSGMDIKGGASSLYKEFISSDNFNAWVQVHEYTG